MKQTINVALLQLKPTPNYKKANLEKGLTACRKATELKADIILFPEMWNTSYQNCDGNSCAFNPDGSVIFQANGKEGIFITKFDMEKIRSFRKEETWGNAFRKPNCYKELIL